MVPPQAAGEIEQGRKLQDVEAEQCRRRAFPQAVAEREADAQGDVEPGRDGNGEEAPAERQREAEPEMHAGDGDALAGDRQPAQAHQRVEPQMPRCAARSGRNEVGDRHGAQFSQCRKRTGRWTLWLIGITRKS